MSEKPLAGWKILVTRPREQAAPLAQRIEQAGGIPLRFPLLEIAPVQDTRALHEQVSRLAQFDLAVFVSPNAVKYGIAAMRAAGASLTPGHSDGTTSHSTSSPKNGDQVAGYPASGIGELKIATVGQGSAKALRQSGVANVIAPTERFDSEGLLALPELQHIAGWRVIIFRGDGGREFLGDELRARGATVEYAVCYRRSKPQWDAKELLDAAPDAITVTSSEALAYLWKMLGDAQCASLRGTPLFVPHARIADLARRQGWLRVRLTDAGDDGLLSALIAWSSETREQNKSWKGN